MKKVFTIVVLFFAGYSIATKTMMLEIVSSNRPAKVYDIRVANFANFFGDSLFDNSEGKIFIFYESLNTNRLYVANTENSSDFYVYQLPRVYNIPWINPQKYMNNRTKVYESQKQYKNCLIKYVPSDSLMNELIDSHLDKHSTIEEFVEIDTDEERSFYGGMEVNQLVLGFSMTNGVKRYFFHKKLNSNALENYRRSVDIRESLEKYDHEIFKWSDKVFSILNKLEMKITFEDCL